MPSLELANLPNADRDLATFELQIFTHGDNPGNPNYTTPAGWEEGAAHQPHRDMEQDTSKQHGVARSTHRDKVHLMSTVHLKP